MRLTMRTDLAMRALMYCAHRHPELLRKTDIARACDVNENHLAQVIHALGLRGFLSTRRGRQGGVTLARPADQISVGAVFRALEADVPFADCFEAEGGDCPLRAVCGLRCLLSRAVAAFYATLDEVTLADLLQEQTGLDQLFFAREFGTAGLPACAPSKDGLPSAQPSAGSPALWSGGPVRQATAGMKAIGATDI